MQTVNLGMAPVKTAVDKKNKIPLNRNIYGSCGFGEVFPHNFKQVEAGTEQELSNETLLYLASVVSPTYGHVNMKFWTYFVAFSDLSRNVAAMLGQTNIVRAGNLIVPTKVPHVPRNLLSLLFLFGAQCSIYKVDIEIDGERKYTHPFAMSNNGDDFQNIFDFVNHVRTASGNLMSDYQGDTNLFGFNSMWLDARMLIDFDFETAGTDEHAIGMRIPLSNPDYKSFCHYQDVGAGWVDFDKGVDVAPVTVAGADFLIERSFTYTNSDNESVTETFAFAFRMHAFGKRLYKALKGAEFQEDFTDKTVVSLLPLFAVYKGYYDSFGLLLYENWENTAAAKMLSLFDDLNLKDFTYVFVTDTDLTNEFSALSEFGQLFIKEVGSMWVTASQDWASIHTRQIGVAPKVDAVSSFDARFLANSTNGTVASVAHLNIPSESQEDDTMGKNQHVMMNSIYHGQLDCELMKRLYLQINRDTLAGKRLETLLRLEGFGDWVDSVKPRFIKYAELAVNFDKVLSQSDTFKDGQGALLGDRGGYGQGYDYIKSYKFEVDEPGYIFTLTAIVPDSGLTNVMSVAWEQIEKLDFFLPQYDALGYEASRIKDICGQLPIAAVVRNGGQFVSRQNVTEKTFGYAPRSSKFKVVHNVCNGDFARRSVRDYFLTYMLDKVIPNGEITQTEINDVTEDDLHYKQIVAYETFSPEVFPLAGNVWRYPTRYPWLGLLTRIFANVGDNNQRHHSMFLSDSALLLRYEFINNENDCFFFLSTLRGCEWTYKKPISDSFETKEDGNDGKSDMVISKA